DRTEAAAARADAAHHHEGRSPPVPALADVGTVRFLAHGVEAEVARPRLDPVVPRPARGLDLEPRGLRVSQELLQAASLTSRAPAGPGTTRPWKKPIRRTIPPLRVSAGGAPFPHVGR